MEYRVIRPEYKPGDPWKYCDSCGVKHRASECRKNWKGLIQCEKCYDPKPAALEPNPVGYDKIEVPDARPLGDPVYHDTVTPDDL